MGENINRNCKLLDACIVKMSQCDHRMNMRIPSVLDLLQDLTAMHTDAYDIGPEGMDRRGYYWVILKMRLHIKRLPSHRDNIAVSTWMQAPDKVSCERDYAITLGQSQNQSQISSCDASYDEASCDASAYDDVMIYGKGVWAVLDKKTGKLVRMDEFYPDLDFDVPTPDEEPFAKISKNFSNADDGDYIEEIGSYTIRSIDIDCGGHVNNVNYVRAMLGAFSIEELESMNITELEFHYMRQVYEGETLTFIRRRVTSDASPETAIDIGAVNEAGEVVFIARIS